MKLGEIFLGKPLHWLLWAVVIVVLYLLGAASLRDLGAMLRRNE